METDLQLMESRKPYLLACLSFLFLLLASFNLSGCKASDNFSSSSSSSASVDQSDNSVRGDTACETTVKLDPETGKCEFTKKCDGAEVSSGDFAPNSEGECVVPPQTDTEQPEVIE